MKSQLFRSQETCLQLVNLEDDSTRVEVFEESGWVPQLVVHDPVGIELLWDWQFEIFADWLEDHPHGWRSLEVETSL